jgi:Tol biopolymer transport system component
LACVLAALVATTAAYGQTSVQDQESRWFRNVRQLTFEEMGLDRAGEAYFSPDSSQVVFLAYPAGKSDYQTFVINASGTGLKMVSTGEGATACPYFHPDGTRLIFASSHLDPYRPEDPSAGNPRGPAPANIAKPPAAKPPAGHPGGSHPGGAAGARHPGGRPEGKHPGGKPGGQHPGGRSGSDRHAYTWIYYPGMDIFEYTLASGELRQLIDSDGYDAECAYSPDGKHIVFSSFRDYDQEIYICDADGNNPRRITHAPGADGGPFFSPDGKRICYRSDRVGHGMLQVYVNNFEGTDERALTNEPVLNWCPFWHPSGKWLMFTKADVKKGRDANFDLYLLRDDGSEMHRVTWDKAFDGLPVFSPDGRYIMWTSRRGGLGAPQIFIAEFLGLTPEGELLVQTE